MKNHGKARTTTFLTAALAVGFLSVGCGSELSPAPPYQGGNMSTATSLSREEDPPAGYTPLEDEKDNGLAAVPAPQTGVDVLSKSSDPVNLNTPWLSQCPPGTWAGTHNCGPTCVLMAAGVNLSENGIRGVDDWLNKQYGRAINNYNGSDTSTTDLVNIAQRCLNLPNSARGAGWNRDKLMAELQAGYPVIVAVRTRMDLNGVGHFMVLRGLDSQFVYVNDPGRSTAAAGANQKYSWSQFDNVWAKSSGRAVVTIHRTGPAASSTLPAPVSAGTYAIRTSNGHYLTAENGGGVNGLNAIHTDRTVVNAWEKFTLVSQPGGTFAIRTANGRYLTAVNAGGVSGPNAIHTDATKVDSWERFTFEPQPGGAYAIRTSSGRYVTAVNAGGVSGSDAIHTDATRVDSWERFTLEVESIPNY